jgi:hypothetical protein
MAVEDDVLDLQARVTKLELAPWSPRWVGELDGGVKLTNTVTGAETWVYSDDVADAIACGKFAEP